LLIVDGHSSYVNLEFTEFAFLYKILILVLPPHSMYQLQPLGTSLFRPLAIEYHAQLNQWLHKSLGEVQFKKRHFWKIFQVAWWNTFTENPEVIQKAF
jgi:hypothetical protein